MANPRGWSGGGRHKRLALVCGALVIASTSVLISVFAAPAGIAAERSPLLLLNPGGDAALFRLAEKEAIVVLADGTELSGTIIEETDTHVTLRTELGVSKIARTKIKEIRDGKGALKGQYDERFARACASKDIAALLELAEWARLKNLSVEYERALRKVVELDADNAAARKELGYARLDGKWIEPREVQNLLLKGYELVGLELRKRAAPEPGTPKPDPSAPKPEPGPATPKPEPATPEGAATPASSGGATDAGTLDITKLLPPSALTGKLSSAERAKREQERASSRPAVLEKLKKFIDRKRAEHQGVEWHEKINLKSEHYNISSNVSEPVTRAYLTLLELFYGELSLRLTGKNETTQQSTVFIYRDHQEFMAQTGMPAGVGGFYMGSTRAVHIFHGVFGPTTSTFGVLGHELTHQVQGMKLANMFEFPVWLIEGMAVYFGDGARLDPEKKRVVTNLIPRDRLRHLKDKISANKQERLRTLISMKRQQFGGSQYSDAWAVVYFLFSGPDCKTKGRPFISQYWLTGKEHALSAKDFEMLADKYYGGIAAMEKLIIDFTTSLQAEPAGEVKKDGFESYEYKFKLRLPAPRWQFRSKDLSENELVVMEVPGTEVKISVRMMNKDDHEQTAETFVREVLWKQFPTMYKDAKLDVLSYYGGEVYRSSYQIPAVAAKKSDAAGPADPPTPAGVKPETAKEQKPGVPPKHCDYYFVGFNSAYGLFCSAPAAVFDEFAEDFEEASRDLEIIPQNRW